MTRRIGLAAGLLLCVVGHSESQSQKRPARRFVTIPVEINNIAGTFLIDTGSNRTIIDSAFAHRLGLNPTVGTERGVHKQTEGSISAIAELVRVGPKSWSDVPLVVLDLSFLSRMQTTPLSGILGTDLLATIKVDLSYAEGTARVVDDSDTEIADNALLVALKEARNRYFVPITIGPSTFEMLLDTGTNVTALSKTAWGVLPSSWKPDRMLEGIQSSGSPAGSFIVCLPALQLGNIVLRERPLRVIMPSQSDGFGERALDGILGGDVLERFEVILDLQRSTMYLKPVPAFRPDPYEFVTVGIQFFKVDTNAFSVLAVWKHSPAEAAGVVVGDRILSVNGHSAVDLGLETFASQLHGSSGTPVVIEVERPAGRVFLHMKTRQLVCESRSLGH